jgi:SAM-dependent methyltransferase
MLMGFGADTEVGEAASLEDVRTFWEANPCAHETASASSDREYFLGVEASRYKDAPFIEKSGRFGEFSGKRVLEIGCGLGTDGAQFAKGGADYVGADLTEAAVDLARRNFSTRGLEGEFVVTNAEELPFPPDSFDHVYSFGVIHHTPAPPAVVAEILRVLKPGGTLTVMLYNRTSINYYIEIMFLRKLGRLLLRPSWGPKVLSACFRLPREKLEGHRQNLLRFPHPTREQWLSMNTDGPECPLSRVYSAHEVRDLFSQFADVETDVHHFDRSHWPIVGGLMGDRVAEMIGRRFGWCRMTYARKPAVGPPTTVEDALRVGTV